MKKVNDQIGHWNRSHPEAQFSENDRVKILRRSVQVGGSILQDEQDKHYKWNNLESLIRGKREEMFKFFLIQIMAKLEIDECVELMKNELEAFIKNSMFDYQVEYVRNRIGPHPWSGDEEASLALVDFKLLLLFNNCKKRKAIKYAVSKSLFSETISTEIKELIHIDEVIQTIIEEVRESIVIVISNIKRLGNQIDSTELLQASLNELKNQAAKRQLTLDVTTSLRLSKSEILKDNQ